VPDQRLHTVLKPPAEIVANLISALTLIHQHASIQCFITRTLRCMMFVGSNKELVDMIAQVLTVLNCWCQTKACFSVQTLQAVKCSCSSDIS
jgi:hypothetical protein